MAKYVWKNPGGKVRIMFGCVALLAIMIFIDGVLKGEPLRALGGILAWPFLTFMIKGVPLPAAWAARAEQQLVGILSMRRGGSSDGFRWIAVALGVAMAALVFAGAYMMLFSDTYLIDSLIPQAARHIDRAEEHGYELVVRGLYAMLFAAVGAIVLSTAWKRARS